LFILQLIDVAPYQGVSKHWGAMHKLKYTRT